jgi:SAM-dependent methyltransferase
MDEVKLSLARREAERRGVANVTFRTADVRGWSEPAGFDLVYCRLLLQHLPDPDDLLRRMWEAVGPGGVIVAEDADFDAAFCDPPNDGHAFWVRTFTTLIARHGGDPTFGRSLHRAFRDADIPEPEIRMRQGLHRSDEGKQLALLSLEATADALVEEGMATEADVRAAVADLEAFTQDPHTLIGEPRMFQVWTRRAS